MSYNSHVIGAISIAFLIGVFLSLTGVSYKALDSSLGFAVLPLQQRPSQSFVRGMPALLQFGATVGDTASLTYLGVDESLVSFLLKDTVFSIPQGTSPLVVQDSTGGYRLLSLSLSGMQDVLGTTIMFQRSLPAEFCVDSDEKPLGGSDSTTPGVVWMKLAGKDVVVLFDQCKNGKTLVERECTKERKVTSVIMDCPYKCRKGGCITAQAERGSLSIQPTIASAQVRPVLASRSGLFSIFQKPMCADLQTGTKVPSGTLRPAGSRHLYCKDGAWYLSVDDGGCELNYECTSLQCISAMCAVKNSNS